MIDTIKKLLEDKESLMLKVNKVDKAIKALQAVCPHTDEEGKDTKVWYANGHNKDYYRCSLCSEETSY